MATFVGSVFTMEVDGKRNLRLRSQKTFRDALELCKEDWLRTDLSEIKSNGIPLWSEIAKLTV